MLATYISMIINVIIINNNIIIDLNTILIHNIMTIYFYSYSISCWLFFIHIIALYTT